MTCMAINDTKLLIYNIISIILQLFVTVGIILFVATFINKDSKKQRQIRKKLEERAKTDPYAQKRLAKMERKRKKGIKERIEMAVAFVIIIALFFVNLFVYLIPGWSDYIKKDYVVYSGKLTSETRITYSGVRRFGRNHYIILEDGTYLSGSLGLSEGEHNVTVVYSKRTEIALDILD